MPKSPQTIFFSPQKIKAKSVIIVLMADLDRKDLDRKDLARKVMLDTLCKMQERIEPCYGRLDKY